MPRDNFAMQERKDKFDALMGVLKGPPGPAGKSAYQVAVDNGFVGTPEEWLVSLKGPKGDKGDDGKSAYQAAVDGGYQGTEADFNAELADIEAAARAARAAADDAEAAQAGAEAAASHYPKIENGNWWVYSAATGAYVDTGISAEGTQGIDGVSPAVSFADITGGHTMTVTDKTHPTGQSINILDGRNGTDGVSPAISITDITGGHRLTITDAAHPQGVSMDIMDGTVGPQGPAGPGLPEGGSDGDVLVKDGSTDYAAKWTNTPQQMGSLATIDTSPATAAHAVGEYIVYNGQLYKVTAEIAPGVTLDPTPQSGNITATNIGRAIKDINDHYSAFKRTNNNLVCFGDSWTVGTGIAVADRPTKRFTAIVAKKLLCTEYNFGVGAAGFIRSGNLFSTQINTANSQMTTEQKENTGVVLIVGGVNDYRQQLTTSTLAQFVEGVVSTANLAHSIFPNALIVLGIGNTNLSYFPEIARQWYSAAISACEHQLEYPSLIIKNLYNVISGNTSMYSSDNLHPNESGHGAFGGYIANAILGGGQSVFSALGTVTLSSGVALDGTEGPAELTLWRVNDEIVVGAARFTFSPAITSAKVIGTIPAKSAPPSNAYYPFYNSDQHAGNIAITASGNVYLIPATGVSSLASGFNQQIRYMFGKPTNNDES